ncbi:hypothetical protein HQ32_00943 [Prauserella sp. Am3]|nr:hypothetical protein HQ32_00943 [Prauserella sp. Am3]
MPTPTPTATPAALAANASDHVEPGAISSAAPAQIDIAQVTTGVLTATTYQAIVDAAGGSAGGTSHIAAIEIHEHASVTELTAARAGALTD